MSSAYFSCERRTANRNRYIATGTYARARGLVFEKTARVCTRQSALLALRDTFEVHRDSCELLLAQDSRELPRRASVVTCARLSDTTQISGNIPRNSIPTEDVCIKLYRGRGRIIEMTFVRVTLYMGRSRETANSAAYNSGGRRRHVDREKRLNL